MEVVVVANRSEANIFFRTSDGTITFKNKIQNPLGRVRNRQLLRHSAGMSRAKFKGSAPHSLAAENNQHEAVATDFAKKIIKHLKSESNKDHGLTFQIVAEPRFSGIIKAEAKRSRLLTKINWLEKDLHKVPPQKWLKILGLKKLPR